MRRTSSISEVRSQLATLIREIEETGQSIEITRRGQPVAVILSIDEYARLLGQRQKRGFWQAYLEWRDKWQVDEWEDEDDPFSDIRDQSSGRLINLE